MTTWESQTTLTLLSTRQLGVRENYHVLRSTYNSRKDSVLVLHLRKIESKTFPGLLSIPQAYLPWMFQVLNHVFKDPRSIVIPTANSRYLEFGTYC